MTDKTCTCGAPLHLQRYNFSGAYVASVADLTAYRTRRRVPDHDVLNQAGNRIRIGACAQGPPATDPRANAPAGSPLDPP